MFINILQYFIISFILILLIHYLYNFFKTNLTIPKVKDLIHKPKERYDEMYESIKYNKKNESNDIDTESMKLELKKYLSELNNKKTEIKDISSYGNNNNNKYSTY